MQKKTECVDLRTRIRSSKQEVWHPGWQFVTVTGADRLFSLGVWNKRESRRIVFLSWQGNKRKPEFEALYPGPILEQAVEATMSSQQTNSVGSYHAYIVTIVHQHDFLQLPLISVRLQGDGDR